MHEAKAMAGERDLTELFAAELRRADPVRLALVIARIAYPDLKADSCLLQLDEMTHAVAGRVNAAVPGEARALALIQAMRLDLGMRGNSERYYDATNSYLNIVLERRTGLPIMLALVLVAIGQRLGLTIEARVFRVILWHAITTAWVLGFSTPFTAR
jgi:regulator of sirC expression with transglutaminase-like and TPR domain